MRRESITEAVISERPAAVFGRGGSRARCPRLTFELCHECAGSVVIFSGRGAAFQRGSFVVVTKTNRLMAPEVPAQGLPAARGYSPQIRLCACFGIACANGPPISAGRASRHRTGVNGRFTEMS
jgi:hypothetical protein